MQTEEILLEYAKRQEIRRHILVGLVGGEFLLFFVGNNWVLPYWLLVGLFILIGAIGLFFLWRYWRCPACDTPLGRELGAHCPDCGTRLVP